MDDFTLVKAMGVAAFYGGLRTIQVVHSDYDLSMKEELLLLFHELVTMFMIMGIFFTDRSYIIFHAIITALVGIQWVALGGNCILTLIKRQTIPYTDEDFVRIYGTETGKKFSFFSVVGLGLAIDAYKLLFRN